MILIIYAHPYPQHSHANKRMLEQARTLEGVEVRSLYQLYPDFNIDIAAEQEALSRADLIVWQHPMQWYSVPPLLKLWMDKVLSHGWAYGHGGTALRGKQVMWAVTTGGGDNHFDIGSHPGFDVLSQPLQATAIYCGLNWLAPFAMHCTFICDDEIDEEQPRVIIAGFGRFGQITGRLLLSSGVKMVVLDHDPDHIETLRKFGMKVFYGDATRMDLLESAGAAKAEVLINAIDDPQTSLELTEMVKDHFPNLQIIARARDVDHYIRLRQAGVDQPERETFEGALKTGRLALESLGLGRYEARERADLFRRFNTQMVEEMAKGENDATSRAAVYKRTSAMLSEIITEDREHLSLIQRHGWQGTEEGKHTGDVADGPEVKPST